MRCDFVLTEYVHETKGTPLCVCQRAACRQPGFAHDPKILVAECRAQRVGVGDCLHWVLKRFFKTCNSCLQRKLLLNRWLNWTVPNWGVRLIGRQAPWPWELESCCGGKLKIAKLG